MGVCWPKYCDEGDLSSHDSDSEVGRTDDETNDDFWAPYPIMKRHDSFGHLRISNQYGRNVFDFYSEVNVIGEGSMGTVSKVRKKMKSKNSLDGLSETKVPKKGLKSNRKLRSTNDLLSMNRGEFIAPKIFQEYALKSIHYNRINDPKIWKEMQNEIEILSELDHPNIVKPIEVFESRKQLCVVMELLSGGDLYSRDPYSEKDAAKIVGKVVSAVAHMHRNNIIHRDLKFENVIFENQSPNAEVKVIDFGLSKRYSSVNPSCTEGVGTIYSMAPQVFQGKYTSQADCWSLGVLTFMLLSSNLPFYGKTRKDVVKQILRCNFKFNSRKWLFISDEAKDFVTDLLQYNPEKRKNARQSLRSPWLKKKLLSSKRRPEQEFLDKVQATLENFSHYVKLKKVTLIVIAHSSSVAEVMNLRRAFSAYDTDDTGRISYFQFKEILKDFFYSEDEIKMMFQAVDIDKRGSIHYTEFLAATLEVRGVIEEEKLHSVFHNKFLKPGKDYLCLEDLKEILGPDTSNDEVKACWKETDVDNDGKISYNDFKSLFQNQLDKVKMNVEKISMRRRISLTNLSNSMNHGSLLSIISSKTSNSSFVNIDSPSDNEDILFI